MNSSTEWKAYTSDEHNYIFFQLNNIRNELNYFDSMYYFWLKCFQTELNGECTRELILIKMKKHLAPFLICLGSLLIFLIIYLIIHHYRKQQRYRTPNDAIQYPNFITT
jgi:hypothetical protein